MQVLADLDMYGVERFAHILYFPVNERPWLAGDGAPHRPSQPTHAHNNRPARTHTRRSLILPNRDHCSNRGAVPSGGMARPPLAGQGDAATLEALMARDAAQHPETGPASAGQKKELVFIYDPASVVERFNYAAQSETVMPEWVELVTKALDFMLPLLTELGFAVVIASAVIDKFVKWRYAAMLVSVALETALPEFGTVVLPPPEKKKWGMCGFSECRGGR